MLLMDNTTLRKRNYELSANVCRLLDHSYPGITLGGLGDKSHEIEYNIERFVVTSIIQYYAAFDTFNKATDTEFVLNRQLYRIMHGSILNKPALEICILNSLNPQKQTISRSIKFNTIGYYNSIELHIVTDLSKTADDIADIIATIYKSAYRWLEESFLEKIADLEKGFANALYRELRTVLDFDGKAELAKQIWFSVFSRKDGYYAIDGNAAKEILNKLKQRQIISEHSPLFHLVKLLGLEMPYEKSLSKYVIADNDYKEFTLSDAEYVTDMLHIFKTEVQMTQGAAYAIFPIATVGKRTLVASFPATLRTYLLPVLETTQGRLSEIYKKESSAMNKHIERLLASYRRVEATEWSGIVGALGTAAVKEYFKA
jgi:hypothetical protein